MSDPRPKPTQTLSKVLTRFRRRGPVEVLGTGIRRLKEFVSSSDELIILARPAGGETPERDDLAFVEAAASDGSRYARDIGTDSRTTFAARLSDASRCFLVVEEGKVLHATWVTTRSAWTRELGGYLLAPGGDCYVYESFTRADARGRGVYPFALEGICAWAAAQELGRVWIGVEADNNPSRRAVAKAGFEPQLTISYRRSLGRLEVSGGRCPEGSIEMLCWSKSG
ncbi:MAG: GNAT family N-acetyltransferase [Actinomycetota bacterium]